MGTRKNMSSEKFNKIATGVFIASFAASIVLLIFGLVFAPTTAQAEERALDKFILSAQGTKIESISKEIPRTPEELALQASMDNLATMNQRAKAESLVSSQISGFKDKQAKIKAEKEAAAAAAQRAAQQHNNKLHWIPLGSIMPRCQAPAAIRKSPNR